MFFFAQKTLFADSLIPSLFRVSPGLFFENAILVLATRHPVLMSTPHQASLRIAFLADAQDARTSILGTSPHKGPYGATRLHPFLGRVWSRRGEGFSSSRGQSTATQEICRKVLKTILGLNTELRIFTLTLFNTGGMDLPGARELVLWTMTAT